MKRIHLLCFVIAFLTLPSLAVADAIDPLTFSHTFDSVGDSITIDKKVTITEEATSDALVDVFFLSDTTGSMGGVISAVKAGASTILSSTSGLGDVAYGVGAYRDVGDAYVYNLFQDITTNTAAVQAGINALTAGGGGDFYEANLYGLYQAATAASWRTGSSRILVWFGDAPGHDPSQGITETAATNALVGAGIQVEALNSSSLDNIGQATRITNATGGNLYSGFGTNVDAIVDVIVDAITGAINTYSSVGLDLSEVPAGVGVTYSGAQTGMWDRSMDRDFFFTVTFTGLTPDSSFTFPIYATVDGGRVAKEADTIAVGDYVIPEPSTFALLGLGVFGLGVAIRRRRRK